MLDGNKIKHQFVQTEMEGFLRDLKTDYSAGDEAMYADASLMKVYRGGTRFAKHYLGPNCVPAFDGEKKDGEGEEFDCAVQIDAHPAVRFWLRNLAKHHRPPLGGEVQQQVPLCNRVQERRWAGC